MIKNEQEIRFLIAEILEKDATFLTNGQLAELGKNFSMLEDAVYSYDGKFKNDMLLIYNFYDEWIDDRTHGFERKINWVQLAHEMSRCLREGRSITNPILISNFSVESISKQKTLSPRKLVIISLSVLFLFFVGLRSCYKQHERQKNCLNKLSGEWNYKKPGCEN